MKTHFTPVASSATHQVSQAANSAAAARNPASSAVGEPEVLAALAVAAQEAGPALHSDELVLRFVQDLAENPAFRKMIEEKTELQLKAVQSADSVATRMENLLERHCHPTPHQLEKLRNVLTSELVSSFDMLDEFRRKGYNSRILDIQLDLSQATALKQQLAADGYSGLQAAAGALENAAATALALTPADKDEKAEVTILKKALNVQICALSKVSVALAEAKKLRELDAGKVSEEAVNRLALSLYEAVKDIKRARKVINTELPDAPAAAADKKIHQIFSHIRLADDWFVLLKEQFKQAGKELRPGDTPGGKLKAVGKQVAHAISPEGLKRLEAAMAGAWRDLPNKTDDTMRGLANALNLAMPWTRNTLKKLVGSARQSGWNLIPQLPKTELQKRSATSFNSQLRVAVTPLLHAIKKCQNAHEKLLKAANTLAMASLKHSSTGEGPPVLSESGADGLPLAAVSGATQLLMGKVSTGRQQGKSEQQQRAEAWQAFCSAATELSDASYEMDEQSKLLRWDLEPIATQFRDDKNQLKKLERFVKEMNAAESQFRTASAAIETAIKVMDASVPGGKGSDRVEFNKGLVNAREQIGNVNDAVRKIGLAVENASGKSLEIFSRDARIATYLGELFAKQKAEMLREYPEVNADVYDRIVDEIYRQKIPGHFTKDRDPEGYAMLGRVEQAVNAARSGTLLKPATLAEVMAKTPEVSEYLASAGRSSLVGMMVYAAVDQSAECLVSNLPADYRPNMNLVKALMMPFTFAAAYKELKQAVMPGQPAPTKEKKDLLQRHLTMAAMNSARFFMPALAKLVMSTALTGYALHRDGIEKFTQSLMKEAVDNVIPAAGAKPLRELYQAGAEQLQQLRQQAEVVSQIQAGIDNYNQDLYDAPADVSEELAADQPVKRVKRAAVENLEPAEGPELSEIEEENLKKVNEELKNIAEAINIDAKDLQPMTAARNYLQNLLDKFDPKDRGGVDSPDAVIGWRTSPNSPATVFVPVIDVLTGKFSQYKHWPEWPENSSEEFRRALFPNESPRMGAPRYHSKGVYLRSNLPVKWPDDIPPQSLSQKFYDWYGTRIDRIGDEKRSIMENFYNYSFKNTAKKLIENPELVKFESKLHDYINGNIQPFILQLGDEKVNKLTDVVAIIVGDELLAWDSKGTCQVIKIDANGVENESQRKWILNHMTADARLKYSDSKARETVFSGFKTAQTLHSTEISGSVGEAILNASLERAREDQKSLLTPSSRFIIDTLIEMGAMAAGIAAGTAAGFIGGPLMAQVIIQVLTAEVVTLGKSGIKYITAANPAEQRAVLDQLANEVVTTLINDFGVNTIVPGGQKLLATGRIKLPWKTEFKGVNPAKETMMTTVSYEPGNKIGELATRLVNQFRSSSNNAVSNADAPADTATPAAGKTHEVKKDESLDSLAKHYGISTRQFALLKYSNPGITDFSNLKPGDKLFIPDAALIKNAAKVNALAANGGEVQQPVQSTTDKTWTPAQVRNLEASIHYGTVFERIVESDAKIDQLLRDESDKSAELLSPIAESIKSQGFSNIKFRAMAIYDNEYDSTPTPHYVLTGEKYGKEYVFDLDARKAFSGINKPIIVTKEAWLNLYSQQGSKNFIIYSDHPNQAAAINHYQKNTGRFINFREGEKAVPGEEWKKFQTSNQQQLGGIDRENNRVIHVVKQGETLFSIAAQHKLSHTQFAWLLANHDSAEIKDDGTLKAGIRLFIPGAALDDVQINPDKLLRELEKLQPKIEELMKWPKNQSRQLMYYVTESLKKMDFEDLRYRAVTVWKTDDDNFPETHFVVIGKKDGKEYVFDLDAGKLLNKQRWAIIASPEAWEAKYIEQAGEKRMVFTEHTSIYEAKKNYLVDVQRYRTPRQDDEPILTKGWFKHDAKQPHPPVKAPEGLPSREDGRYVIAENKYKKIEDFARAYDIPAKHFELFVAENAAVTGNKEWKYQQGKPVFIPDAALSDHNKIKLISIGRQKYAQENGITPPKNLVETKQPAAVNAEKKPEVKADKPAEAPPAATVEEIQGGVNLPKQNREYITQPGDTLKKISYKFYGYYNHAKNIRYQNNEKLSSFEYDVVIPPGTKINLKDTTRDGATPTQDAKFTVYLGKNSLQEIAKTFYDDSHVGMNKIIEANKLKPWDFTLPSGKVLKLPDSVSKENMSISKSLNN